MAPQESYQRGRADSRSSSNNSPLPMTTNNNSSDEQAPFLCDKTISLTKRRQRLRQRRCGQCLLWTIFFAAIGLAVYSGYHRHHDKRKPHHHSHSPFRTSQSSGKNASNSADYNNKSNTPSNTTSSSFGDDSGATSQSEKDAQQEADSRLQYLNLQQEQQKPSSNEDENYDNDCEATILLMRHCEKLGPDHVDAAGHEHCTYLGYQRAEYLATLFDHNNSSHTSSATSSTTTARWPTPAQLYAYRIHRSDGGLNFREWETLKPLSDAVVGGLDIQLADSSQSLADDLFDWLTTSSSSSSSGKNACGKVTLVSWRHSKLPDLAQALGCGPDNGCPTDYPGDNFDLVWQLQFVYNLGGGASSLQRTAYHDQEQALVQGSTTPRDEPKQASVDPAVSKRKWHVYATVDRLGFDPLAFGRTKGKYP